MGRRLDGPALPEPLRRPEPISAVEQMARVLRASGEPVTLVSTGPLTNVAALLLSHPELKSRIGRISMMGGGIRHGNWTPAAEFNILVDPEAAELVFRSGVPITMAGLDVTEQALVYPEEFQRAIQWPAWWPTGWTFSTGSIGRRATGGRLSTTAWPWPP